MLPPGHEYEIDPRWAIDALLDVEPFNGVSWDPSYSNGSIPQVMSARGLSCFGSEITQRNYNEAMFDFFTDKYSVDNIVTHPPYRLIEPYICRALKQAHYKVAILTRLAFLESVKRRAFFQATPLARIWLPSQRMATPACKTNKEAKGGSATYAWFVWEHGHEGAPTIGWLP